MSNGRGDLPHPPKYYVSKSSPFLNLSSKIANLLSYLNTILIVCLSCFTFVTTQRKNIPPEMTIQECVYYTIFSVHSLLQYIVSVTCTKFLYMDSQYAFKHYTT